LKHWVEDAYREHRHAMVHVAWVVLRDHQLAEDAVHSAVQRLLAHKAPAVNHRSYVLQAARRAGIDLLRKQQRHNAQPLSSAGNGQAVAGNGSAEVEVDDLLSTLDDDKREIVQLKLQAGLTFKEIAEVLDKPISTVSSRYSRAIAELRSVLEKSHDRD